MSAFSHAWDLVKALSTEDLRFAARTGGIPMTPERRQAYADAAAERGFPGYSLPLSTGGGFRTMPETEAERLIRYQKTGSHEGIHGYTDDPKHPLFDPKQKTELAEFLQQDFDTGGSLDMDDRLYDKHHILTQGQSMPDPMEIQEPTVVGSQKVESIGRYGLPVPNYEIEAAHRSQQRGRPPKSALPIGARTKITQSPSGRRTVSEPTAELYKPFISTDPPRNPESELSRRGEAGASPSDKAFRIIQQRKDNAKRNAERMEEVRAERQREMMMQRQRDRMKSRTPPQARARRREGPNQRKMRLKREAERRKNR